MIDGKRAESLLRKRFSAAGDAESAARQKAYMKSELAFHGVPNAECQKAARGILSEHADLDHEGLVRLCDALLHSPWFDVRSTGAFMLERKAKTLSPSDLPWLVEMVRHTACWAHVDLLATNVVGPIVARHPKALAQLSKWAGDPSFWVRRTALLAQDGELRRGRGDFDLFARLAAPMLEEKEFFIRKAIGWVLRDTSKKRPELAHAFLLVHRAKVSGLTLREGAKYLPPKMRSELGLDVKPAR